MASIVLGVAGAAVGSFFGMPQLGWAIGSAIGGALFKPDGPHTQNFGPRLGDLHTQTATYGKSIPKVYGSGRVAGNMIWAQDIEEVITVTENEAEGKGGEPATSTTTTYTYFQSFAIGLCEGPITGVLRIWMNGELAYTIAAGTDPNEAIASSTLPITLYTGSETQLPNSTIQGTIGIADTPAYRGLAYVVFTRLPLLAYNNRTPNVEFEVVTVGEPAFAPEVVFSSYKQSSPYTAAINNWNSKGFLPSKNSLDNFVVYAGGWDNSYANRYVRVYQFKGTTRILRGVFTCRSNNPFCVGYADAEGFLNNAGATFYWESIKGSLYSYTFTLPEIINYQTCRYVKSGNDFFLCYNVTPTTSTTNLLYKVTVDPLSQITPSIISTDIGATKGAAIYVYDSKLYVLCNSSPYQVLVYDLSLTLIDTIPLTITWVTSDMSTGTSIYVNSTGIYLFLGSKVYEHIISTGITSIIHAGTSIADNTLREVTVLNRDTILISNLPYSSVPAMPTLSIGSLLYTYRLTKGSVALSSIITDICIRAGVDISTIDTSYISTDIIGYTTQLSSARAQLEQLLQAFSIDVIESSGTIKFIPRLAGSNVISIDLDESSADLEDSIIKLATINRKQYLELPSEVLVQYFDTDRSYQVGSQYSRRDSIPNISKLSINFAISMDSAAARKISDILLYDMWTSRSSFDINLPRTYWYLEPTDKIHGTIRGRDYNLRIISEEYSEGVLKYQAVLQDTDTYTSTSVPSVSNTTTTSLKVISATLLNILDIPLLQDKEEVGPYVALTTQGGNSWSGAVLLKSFDGISGTPLGTGYSTRATSGEATSILGPFNSGNIFDELNTLDVQLVYGALSSTSTTLLLSGANTLLVGNEIIQFRTAELIDTSKYRLSGLLRGRKGTEQYMGTHTILDKVFLLSSTSIAVLPILDGEVGLLRYYAPISIGESSSFQGFSAFTYTGAIDKPYSPVQLGGGRDTATGDITINWIRRARLNASWANSIEVPLGESTELYDVEIYTSSAYTTLQRTISNIATTTTTYTSAMQVADFGVNQATIYFKVFQRSSSVGRGFEAKGIV
jgi:hypothetical protein